MASIRPLEAEKNRVIVIIGRDRLEHEGKMSTTPETLTTVKMQLNSTISTKEARHIIEDIKDFIMVHQCKNLIKLVPQEIVEQHNLNKLASKEKVHFEIQK